MAGRLGHGAAEARLEPQVLSADRGSVLDAFLAVSKTPALPGGHLNFPHLPEEETVLQKLLQWANNLPPDPHPPGGSESDPFLNGGLCRCNRY